MMASMDTSSLLRWFRRNARPLPWRRHYRPYEVWISEIMLQQTQMDTALPYFERWMRLFPDVRTLAGADEEKVLKTWQGLGYYSRARNLMRAARRIVEKHSGTFPEDPEAIRALPGVGPYTAGAIESIAFNRESPIVDGNVLRVLSRVYALGDRIDTPKGRARFWDLERSLIPKGRARAFNQALMELGALVCAPKNPLCGRCPLRRDCRARLAGDPEAFPVRSPRKKTVRVEAAALVLERRGRVFVRRRPVGRIMGGLWEFPEWKIARGRVIGARETERLARRAAVKEFGGTFAAFERVGTLRRNYTHHLESLHVFRASVPSKPSLGARRVEGRGWPSAWITRRQFARYPFSSAHSKIAALLSGSGPVSA